MQLREIITRGVEQVSTEETIQSAAEKMAAEDIGFVVVTDADGHGRGVLTDRDIIVRCLGQRKNPATTSVAECMSHGIAALPENADLREAVEIMEKQQIRRILVVDSSQRSIGVLSLADLAQHLRNH